MFIVKYYSNAEGNDIGNGHPVDKKKDDEQKPFVPTDEWQAVDTGK